MTRIPCLLIAVLFTFLAVRPAVAGETVRIGSKRFTESYVLGEILREKAAQVSDAQVIYHPGLGNTGIVFAALQSGSIDVYPEYTGTIARELLKTAGASDLADLNRQLAPLGLQAGIPLGFNDTYALAMPEAEAQRLHITRVSDLARYPQLRLGLSPEFIGRSDGWPGLKRTYHLPFATPQSIDHGLAFAAIRSGRIDVIDIYSTDAKIDRYHLRVLEDDRHYFPAYEAVLLYRQDLPQRCPAIWASLIQLKNRISAAQMRQMNTAAELQGDSFAAIAAAFLQGTPITTASETEGQTFWHHLFGPDFGRLAVQHLLLVFISLMASVLVGIPLGILAFLKPRWAQPILGGVSIIQTIPSLALLAFLIALLHTIGTLPALVALFLYALLPIVQNTYAGLREIPPGLRESAQALGLPASARLRLVELPLAAASIQAGIKTSAVINVGTATIAAFIGAGGFGERIATGLALNDTQTLLAGAIPAAVLALLVQWLFSVWERRGRRHQPGG